MYHHGGEPSKAPRSRSVSSSRVPQFLGRCPNDGYGQPDIIAAAAAAIPAPAAAAAMMLCPQAWPMPGERHIRAYGNVEGTVPCPCCKSRRESADSHFNVKALILQFPSHAAAFTSSKPVSGCR